MCKPQLKVRDRGGSVWLGAFLGALISATLISATPPCDFMLPQGLLRLLPPPEVDPVSGVTTAPPAGTGLATGSAPAPADAAADAEAAAAPAAAGAGRSAREVSEGARLTEAAYSTLAVLVVRSPGAVRGSLAVPRLVFGRLIAEQPGKGERSCCAVGTIMRCIWCPSSLAELRLAAGELLAALAGAYSPPPPPDKQLQQSQKPPTAPLAPVYPAILEELHGLLANCAGHADYRVRLAALDWAVRIYPFSNVRARYLCVRLVGEQRGARSSDFVCRSCNGKIICLTRAGDPQSEVREAARRGLRAPALNASKSGANRRTGALAEADRNDLSVVSRRSDVHGVVSSGTPEPAATGDSSDEAPQPSDAAFAAAAPRYPLFSALVRFLTTPPDDDDSPGTAVPAADGSWEARGPTGEVEPLLKKPRLALALATAYGGASESPDFVDQPDAFRLTLGPVVTTLPSMALAAALEFAGVCLDASACVAGVSPSAYIVALDEDEVEGLRCVPPSPPLMHRDPTPLLCAAQCAPRVPLARRIRPGARPVPRGCGSAAAERRRMPAAPP